MIEIGTIVELKNNKKYIITASSKADNRLFYLALEVDSVTEEPKMESMFFEDFGTHLLPITAEGDIIYLKNLFVEKFIDENIDKISDDETV